MIVGEPVGSPPQVESEMRVEEREGSGLSPPLPNGGGTPQTPIPLSPLHWFRPEPNPQDPYTLINSNQITNLRIKGQRWVGKNKQTSETDPDQTSLERKRDEREYVVIIREQCYSPTRCATAHTFISQKSPY